jgi:glutamine---fructose-6-phosphate transaminase (isomerizing)
MSSEFRDAIYAQPENLRLAREAFADAVAELDLAPVTAGTTVFSGVGASAHALTPAVFALRAAERRAFAISTGELRAARAAGLGDAFVLVSQSGASMETVEALAGLDGAPVVVMSAHGESPLARASDAWLPLGPLDDTRVATLSYTATLQALGLLCDALLRTSSGWLDLPDLAAEVLDHTAAILPGVAESFAPVLAIDAVGGGVTQASAKETALLAREGLRLPALGMETREYLHGPLEAVEDGFGCIVFGGEREVKLAAELASLGAIVTLITARSAGWACPVHAIEIPSVPDLGAPILQILQAQLPIEQVASLRGFEIGNLRRQQPDTKVV